MKMFPAQHTFLATLLACLLLAPMAGAGEWQLVKDTGNLRVERRPYAGSSLAELRGVTVVQATLNEVMALLRDAPFNQQWVYRSGGARILEERGYAQVYVYGIVDAPLPLRDRDTVVRFDYAQDPVSGVITVGITNFPEFAPEESGLVRVPDFGGFWRLQPRQGGRVEVTYQVRGDPGGWVPLWLANYAAEVSVTQTLANMGKAVQRYRGAESEYVMELPGG
jgi:hypothetical protein